MHTLRWFGFVGFLSALSLAHGGSLSENGGTRSGGAPIPSPGPTMSTGPAPVFEVLEEGGGGWRPVDLASPIDGSAGQNCTVAIRWQSTVAWLSMSLSQARVHGLPWVRLGQSFGDLSLTPPPPIQRYVDDRNNSLFFINVELNQDCERRRRYRFHLDGREHPSGSRRFVGITREFYFPSSTEWTTSTDLDLGYLDLCMHDSRECDGPYYPAGNPTPYPGAPISATGTRTAEQGLEARSDAVVDGQPLGGEWVRIDSNNDPNDLMRIRVEGNGAVITSVPASVSAGFQVGSAIWQAIGGDGSLEIRGSDGNYYAARLTFERPDLLTIDIDHTGRGNDQTWQRPGPTIAGDWERVWPAGAAGDGTQVRGDGAEASIRYLPASAPRRFRVGTRLWQGVRWGGVMEVLAADGSYQTARVTLIGSDSLRIDGAPGADVEIWVRPGTARAARIALVEPPPNPNDPPSNLEAPGGLPELEIPGVPPPPPGVACLATSLPHDDTGLTWGWGLTSPTNDDPREETLGIREHMMADLPATLTNVPTEIERSRIPGFEDGFGFAWQQMSRRVSWEEHRDLTAAEFERRSEAAQDAGLRALDIEAYATPSGTRYAGIWTHNPEGIDWRVDLDLTGEAYGQAFENLRENGYRLVDMEAYPTSAGIRYAALWYRSCDNTNWRQVRDMTRAAYDSRLDSLGALGFRVVDFESYRTPAGQRYAAVWQQMPASRAWAVRTDRTLDWFLNYHREYVDRGLRLIDYESYDTPDGVRYAGVWAENDARHDLPFRVALDDSIQAYRERHGIPGISVVVMQGTEVVYRRGFGWADSTQQKAAHSGTVCLTGSVAKVIGGTLAARLEQRGLLDLTRPTADYLDDLPSHHTHTVEQLLAKTGCVPHYAEGNEPDATQSFAWRMPALEQIWADPLLAGCVPGEQYHYSTHGFIYVGAVLEEILEQPIADVLAGELTMPLQLHGIQVASPAWDQGFAGLGVRPHHLSRGYRWTAATGSLVRDYEDTTWKVLGGGLQADALDLARFGQLTRDNLVADTTRLWTPLTDATTVNWATGTTNGVPRVGLAWVLTGANPRLVGGQMVNRRIAEHGGVTTAGFGGARAHLRIYRDEGLVITILTNQRETTLTSAAMNLTAGDPHPIPSLSTTIAEAIFNPPPP